MRLLVAMLVIGAVLALLGGATGNVLLTGIPIGQLLGLAFAFWRGWIS